MTLFNQEQTILDVLMGELLENGELSEACQLAKHFGYYSEDLIIISVSFSSVTYFSIWYFYNADCNIVTSDFLDTPVYIYIYVFNSGRLFSLQVHSF